MKKIGIIVVLALLAALALSSCSRELCPAYGSAQDTPEQVG